jgi:hypothetical protein
MNVLEDNVYTRAWRHLGETLPRPKAIVVVSAHWFTRGTGVTAMEAPKTIHDFGGFPQALYDTHYPAPGSPELAQELVELLAPVPVALDKEAWGFDHGSWLVAGIQLSANDMLKLGDWLEMPKYGANGTVTDIGLTTVKVRNFDNTITTIPTWALVSDAFINWSGMSASGGRRIKRSLNIDTTSIHFLDAQEQERCAGRRNVCAGESPSGR